MKILITAIAVFCSLCAGVTDTYAQCTCKTCGKHKQAKATSEADTVHTPQAMKTFSCKLTSSELRKRKEGAIAGLKRQVLEKKELPDGYSYKFAGTDEMLDSITSFIKSERQCCSFFHFRMSVTNDSFIWLDISGEEGVKEFIATELDM